LSIAEYCNRGYDSASPSNIHDAIFSVHFSSATGDVHLATSLNADDRQRLDADFNAASPTEDDDICPYATSAEVEQLQAARDGQQGRQRRPETSMSRGRPIAGSTRPRENGENDRRKAER